jgi:hypothetical protein
MQQTQKKRTGVWFSKVYEYKPNKLERRKLILNLIDVAVAYGKVHKQWEIVAGTENQIYEVIKPRIEVENNTLNQAKKIKLKNIRKQKQCANRLLNKHPDELLKK